MKITFLASPIAARTMSFPSEELVPYIDTYPAEIVTLQVPDHYPELLQVESVMDENRVVSGPDNVQRHRRLQGDLARRMERETGSPWHLPTRFSIVGDKVLEGREMAPSLYREAFLSQDESIDTGGYLMTARICRMNVSLSASDEQELIEAAKGAGMDRSAMSVEDLISLGVRLRMLPPRFEIKRFVEVSPDDYVHIMKDNPGFQLLSISPETMPASERELDMADRDIARSLQDLYEHLVENPDPGFVPLERPEGMPPDVVKIYDRADAQKPLTLWELGRLIFWGAGAWPPPPRRGRRYESEPLHGEVL